MRERGEVDLPPVDPLMGEVAGLLQYAAAFETRGAQALDARDWATAVEQLSKAASLAPGNAFTRLNLGTAFYMQGRADAALEQYREAVRLAPSLARAHFGIGVLMETRKQDEEAIKAFKAAVANDSGYVEARFSLGNALRRNGRVNESLARAPRFFASIRRCHRQALDTPWVPVSSDGIRTRAIVSTKICGRFQSSSVRTHSRGCWPQRRTIASATACGPTR
jgi:tetratricopeptide (TPR) repeat protein